MNFIRRGTGAPLLLLHGIGGSTRSWSTIAGALAAHREIIAVDLPGFGKTPPLPGEVSVRTLADAVTRFVREHRLGRIDAVGSSMGARLVLELARRGELGAVVSLDPGGFWNDRQRHLFYTSIRASIALVRLLQPVMPQILSSPAGRVMLLSQLSSHPSRLASEVALDEMRSFAASPSFDELLWSLAYGEAQEGAPHGSMQHPLVIGWGRKDRVCFPSEAKRALELFPDATIHWFEDCGHFPQWDAPAETVRVVLEATGPAPSGA